MTIAEQNWWVKIAGSLNSALDIFSNLFSTQPAITYVDKYNGGNLYYRNVQLRKNMGTSLDFPTGASYNDAYKQDGGFTVLHDYQVWGSGNIQFEPVGRILYAVTNDAPIAPYYGYVWTGRINEAIWTDTY
nr:hypothetical protein [Lysinibacillus timonensis]